MLICAISHWNPLVGSGGPDDGRGMFLAGRGNLRGTGGHCCRHTGARPGERRAPAGGCTVRRRAGVAVRRWVPLSGRRPGVPAERGDGSRPVVAGVMGVFAAALDDHRRAHGIVRLRRRHADGGAQFSSLDGDAPVPPRLGLDAGIESRCRTDVWCLRPSHLASWRGAEFPGGLDAGRLRRDPGRGARR